MTHNNMKRRRHINQSCFPSHRHAASGRKRHLKGIKTKLFLTPLAQIPVRSLLLVPDR